MKIIKFVEKNIVALCATISGACVLLLWLMLFAKDLENMFFNLMQYNLIK